VFTNRCSTYRTGVRPSRVYEQVFDIPNRCSSITCLHYYCIIIIDLFIIIYLLLSLGSATSGGTKPALPTIVFDWDCTTIIHLHQITELYLQVTDVVIEKSEY
jgi:hypothetical protein